MSRGGKIKAIEKPLEIKDGVLRFCQSQEYAASFGYQWPRYGWTQIDSILNQNLSRKRLELNLGFPLEFLEGMNVLEVGCGAGRFTEHFVKYAKNVVAVDLSEAIYSNPALGKENLLALQADLLNIPRFSQDIDLVFCRGVLQHTPDPIKSLQKLFDYAGVGSLVIFDIYKKMGNENRRFQYFWGPRIQRWITLEKFNEFLNKNGEKLYRIHHLSLKFIKRFGPFKKIIAKTPLYLNFSWEEEYPNLNKFQRLETFKMNLVDTLYAKHDHPMTLEEVVSALAQIGQIPYSYDRERNHFRCKKELPMTLRKVRITKNGVIRCNLITQPYDNQERYISFYKKSFSANIFETAF